MLAESKYDTMPSVCGMMRPIGSMPQRKRRPREAEVASLQMSRRQETRVRSDATRERAFPVRGARQARGPVRIVPGLNLLQGGKHDGKGIYD
jgi:hypothetical protein